MMLHTHLTQACKSKEMKSWVLARWLNSSFPVVAQGPLPSPYSWWIILEVGYSHWIQLVLNRFGVFCFLCNRSKKRKKPIFYQLFYAWKFWTLLSFHLLSHLSCLALYLICRDTASVRPIASPHCVLVSFWNAEVDLAGRRETCGPRSTIHFCLSASSMRRVLIWHFCQKYMLFPLGTLPWISRTAPYCPRSTSEGHHHALEQDHSFTDYVGVKFPTAEV